MKKLLYFIIIIMMMFNLSACGNSDELGDYPPAIMVNDKIYIQSDEIVTVDNYDDVYFITKYTSSYPDENNECNFNRDVEMPYKAVDDGIAVFYDEQWVLFIEE